MSMDLMNKYVECISDNCSLLTKGKIYEIKYEGDYYVKVINNVGQLREYPYSSFRKLTNQEEVKINAITSNIKPTYYGTGIDVIEFCLRNNLTFMQGNVIKYVTRYKSKNGIEDLEKAKEYIDRLIEFEKRSDK